MNYLKIGILTFFFVLFYLILFLHFNLEKFTTLNDVINIDYQNEYNANQFVTDNFSKEEIEENKKLFAEKVKYDTTYNGEQNIQNQNYNENEFVRYHISEDTLRTMVNHPLKEIKYTTPNGKIKTYLVEKTQALPIYYFPGSYKYGTKNYVPTYEESIKLRLVRDLYQ